MRKLFLPFLAAVLFAIASTVFSQAPDWWIERGVVPLGNDESSAETKAQNYDYATVGQLMHVALQAKAELEENADGGAGADVNAMVAAFEPYRAADPLKNYAYANIGQLKYVSQKFFDRLYSLPDGIVGWPSCMSPEEIEAHQYPWGGTADGLLENISEANGEFITIGQIKNMFSWSILPLATLPDSDGDGIPNIYEDAYGSDWGPNVEAARILSVVPVGGNIRTGENGTPLAEPLRVKVVNEKGAAVSGVPLSFSATAGTLAASSAVTDANGVASTGFTPAFSEGESSNIIDVAINSERQKANVRFSVLSVLSEYTPHSESAYKEKWETDKDLMYIDPKHADGMTGSLKSIPIEVGYKNIKTEGEVYPYIGKHCGRPIIHSLEPDMVSGIYTSVSTFFFPFVIGEASAGSKEWHPCELCGADDECLTYLLTTTAGLQFRKDENKECSGYFDCYGADVLKNRFICYDENPKEYVGHGLNTFGAPILYKPGTKDKVVISDVKEAKTNWPLHSNYNTAIYHRIRCLEILPWPTNIKRKDLVVGTSSLGGTIRSSVVHFEKGKNVKVKYVLEGAQNLWIEDEYGNDLDSYVEFKRKPGLRSRGILRVCSGWDTQSEVACDTYNVEIPPVPSLPSFIAPSRESAGPRYRKISLTGRPISDEKPQSETEDDSEPFETYVDALSLSLRHEVADIAVPIPGSEMTLSVRRSYMPESWNLSGGLRPHERPDLAFGINWMTNAVSYIRMEIQDLDNPGNRTTPDSATVIDENGAAFEFAAYKGKFYPMPAGRSERHSYLNTLETETLNGVEELVFRKKYGTVLRYESVPKISLRTNTGRITPTKNFMDYHYYRLKSVEDRYGNKIMYSYKEDAKTLIPESISVDGRPDIAVHFEQNGGRITKAWDPDGNCTEYSYSEATTDPSDLYETSSENGAIEFIPDSVDLDSVSCTYLSKVSRSDLDVITYGYGAIKSRIDAHALSSLSEPFYNFYLPLISITDATNRTYSFNYGGDLGICSYDSNGGFFIPNDRPEPIAKVTMPDGSFATFVSDSRIEVLPKITLPDGNGGEYDVVYEINSDARRKTVVRDADGNQVVYTWLNGTSGASQSEGEISVSIIQNFYQMLHGIGETPSPSFRNPITMYFPYMRIDHFDGSGEGAALIGSETFEFEPEAGMGLKKTTDFSGNITEYEYNDALPESRASLAYAAKFSDPNKETRTVGGIEQSKLFTYSEDFRIMDSMTDELGRVTKWEVDSLGRRTSEKVYASAANATAGTGALKETSFTYDTTFKGFLADTTIKNGAGFGKNMTTRNVPDANGRIASTIVDPDGLEITTSYQYNKNGRKILETDPNGNQTAFEYDAFNRLVKRTNPDATTNLISYDGAGRKISETNENGAVTVYAYNPNGLLSTTTILMEQGDGNDITTSTEYSHAGKILKTTDGNGNDTVMKYDGMGRLLKMVKYEGEAPANADPEVSSDGVYVTKYAYEGNCGSGVFSTENFKPSAVTDPRGNTSYFTHDELYRETSVRLPFGENGSTTRYVYSKVGNKTRETDPLGNATNFTYNALSLLTSTTFPDLSRTFSTYTPAGLVLTETDEFMSENGQSKPSKIHTYDKAGRRISTKSILINEEVSSSDWTGPVEEFGYDANGNMIWKKDALGNRTDFVYDSRNRLVSELAPAVMYMSSLRRPTKTSVYDGVGNIVKTVDPNGNETDTEYDNANRPVKITFPEVCVGGNFGDPTGIMARPVELRAYDKNGNLASVTNPRGIVTETSYNCFNKPVCTVKNAGAANEAQKITELMSYNANGNLLEITDGNGNKTRYEYDPMNRRTKATYGYGSPNTRFDTWEYDALNLSKHNDIYYSYDRRNRKTSEGYYESYYDQVMSLHSYEYDVCGRITNDGFSYSYDTMGRLVGESAGSYVLDLAGRRTKARFSSLNPTEVLDYSYDTNGRIVKITDQAGRSTLYKYDLNGNILEKSYPNGTVVSYTYDALNRMRSIRGGAEFNFYYDICGNVTAWQDLGREIDMTYDAFDRLKTEYIYDGTAMTYNTYTYDKNSNRTGLLKEVRGPSNPDHYNEETVYTINAMNQLLSAETTRYEVSPEDGSVNLADPTTETATFTYNDRGCLTRMDRGSYSEIYTYDIFCRLGSARKATNTRFPDYSYSYTGRGLLSTEYVYTGGRTRDRYLMYYSDGLMVKKSKTGGLDDIYYRGPDQGGGVAGINYAEKSDGTGLNYKFYNLRGDVVRTENAFRRRISQSSYDAFGEHTDLGSITTDTFTANTKEENSLGLLNEGKRWRSLKYGVFLTPDPLEYVDGFNPYIYCNQNPWGRWDPLGLAAEDGSKNLGALRVWANQIYDAQKAANGGKSSAEIEQRRAETNSGLDTLQSMANTAEELSSLHPAVSITGFITGESPAGNSELEGTDRIIEGLSNIPILGFAGKISVKGLKAKKTFQTYLKKNPKTGKIYSGRTSGTGSPEANVRARDRRHHKNNEGYGQAELDRSSSNPDAIRGQEQMNIEKYGGAKSQGGSSGNAINSVGSGNPKAQQYKDAAEKEFGK